MLDHYGGDRGTLHSKACKETITLLMGALRSHGPGTLNRELLLSTEPPPEGSFLGGQRQHESYRICGELWQKVVHHPLPVRRPLFPWSLYPPDALTARLPHCRWPISEPSLERFLMPFPFPETCPGTPRRLFSPLQRAWKALTSVPCTQSGGVRGGGDKWERGEGKEASCYEGCGSSILSAVGS